MPTPVPSIVAELDSLRQVAGLTVYALAQGAALSPQTTANLLAGSGGKTLDNLAAAGAALGYRLAWVPIKPRPKPKPRR